VSGSGLFAEEERPTPASPREFSIRSIGAPDACKLNAIWHSRFPIIDWSNVVRNRYYACYVLETQGVAYGVAIWSSPIAAARLQDGQSLLELRRLALSPECPKNTATWMLARMQEDIQARFPEVIRLISYQDTEVHHGTIYKAANWQMVNVSPGGEWIRNDGQHRSKAQSAAPKARWEMELKRRRVNK